MKWKMKNSTWIFVFQKYGKFWSISQGHFIKHKPLISEEWVTNTSYCHQYIIILVLKFKKFHSAFHPNFRFQLSQQQPEIKNSQVIKCIWNPWILMLLLRIWIYEFVRNDIARVFCSMKKTCGRVGRQRGWGEKNFNRLSPCFFFV